MKRLSLTPYVIWMVLFTVVPMLLVLYYAFTVPTEGGTTWSLENFTRFFQPIYLRVFIRSLNLAVISTLMFSFLIQVIGVLPGLGAIHPYLLSTQFNAWQGLLREPVDWAPIVRAAWVCALYGVPALFAAFTVFLRRDVAGG